MQCTLEIAVHGSQMATLQVVPALGTVSLSHQVVATDLPKAGVLGTG